MASKKMPVPVETPSLSALHNNRDTRAQEALRMKDEQLRILTEQNTQLLKSLDKVEDECNQIQIQKLSVEEETRKLKDLNFELQTKNRALEAALTKIEQESDDKDKKLEIMTRQNSELLRLLETEEAQTATLEKEVTQYKQQLEGLKGKYSSLLTTAKTHEEMATRAAREGQLRAEELRLLRAECEQLRSQNAEMQRKSAVEIESLQEQLRVRKEKQYHLLEKMQASDEAKRQAEDHSQALTEKMRTLHARVVELETQLQVETRAKRQQEEANRNLSVVEENLRRGNAELQEKTRKAELERKRMESEARDSSEQLREMAEKVFQLLERLKLAELGKTKSIEQLKKCEQELLALKKKNSRLLKESTKEGKDRVKAELDKKVLVDQIRALKTHNTQLAHRCKEEVKSKLKEHEERKISEEKVKTLGGRLSFLLNKLQADEEVKIINREEMKRQEAQIRTLQEKTEELLVKLNATGESNRIITQAMRLKQEEVEGLQIKYAALVKRLRDTESKLADELCLNEDGEESRTQNNSSEGKQKDSSFEPDTDAVRQSGGKGRFYLDPKPTQGFILLKANRPSSTAMLKRFDMNGFLKRAQRSKRFKEIIIEKFAMILGLLNVEEDDHEQTNQTLNSRIDQVNHLVSKLDFLQNKLNEEEEAKRRTLLRYVHSMKAAATEDSKFQKGVIQLGESGIGDEEVHALAALLRGCKSITELNLRNNTVTDAGARALSAALAGPPTCSIRNIDLRNNALSKTGVLAIAEALERSERTRHVYVHAGGKVEALGTTTDSGNVSVDTVCVVDMRDNDPSNREKNYNKGDKSKRKALASNPGKQQETKATKVNSETKAPASQEECKGSNREVNKNFSINQHTTIMQKKKPTKDKDVDRKLKAAEKGWSGRAGGIDLKPSPSATKPKQNKESEKTTILPPLTPPSSAEGRNRTISTPPEAVAAVKAVDQVLETGKEQDTDKKKQKSSKKKKLSAFEQRLADSPLKPSSS